MLRTLGWLAVAPFVVADVVLARVDGRLFASDEGGVSWKTVP